MLADDSDSVIPAPYSTAMLWRVSPSRSRRIPPVGFIQPARPLLTSKPRSGPEWIHEVKHDGYRLIALKEAARVVLCSRYATDYTDTFLSIANAVRALPVDKALLDGEAIVFRSDGHSDFAALRTNRGAAQACFVVYDLLRFRGEDWRSMPLEVRRARLRLLVAGGDGLTFSEAIEGDGVLVFDHACRLGLEGIVSKRLGGLYASGRCRNWLIRSKTPRSSGVENSRAWVTAPGEPCAFVASRDTGV
jgi:bifunctional non-homologous end joining protein LigD